MTMQAALSSVNCGLNSKPSFEKNSMDRLRSRTGRFTNILRLSHVLLPFGRASGVRHRARRVRSGIWTPARTETHRRPPKKLASAADPATGYADRVSGRPKRGNSVSMSRNEFMPAMRSPASSSTMSAQASCPPLGRRRGTARTRASRTPPSARGASRGSRRPRPREPLRDRLVALQPERVGRHREGRVLAQQRRERVDVVALERVARSGRRSSAARRRAARRVAEARRVASVARARCSALLTAATDVSRLSATSAADQPSTSVRSSAARCLGGRCCSAATNARRMLCAQHGLLGRIGVGGQRARVGDRLEPVRARPRARARRRRCRPGPLPSAARGASDRRARRGRRSSRCGTATCAATSARRSGRGSARRGPSSPGPRRRRRRRSRACGSSGP